jgi:DNA-binding MarR family transcriptional regulator
MLKGKFKIEDYRALAEFRFQLRVFQRVMEQAAREEGIQPQHHQLLLAIKGLPPDVPPSIHTLAERMQIAHHSAVELIDRVAKAGYVTRSVDASDRRKVNIHLTTKAEKLLAKLAVVSRKQLGHDNGKLLGSLKSVLKNNKSNR